MMPGLLALIGVLILTMQVMAGVWTPNNFSYKPDEGARGKQEKVRFDTGSDRIDARLGKEIWVGDPNYGPTLQGAITAIGDTAAILRLPIGTHSINADLTIPANVTLAVERGAILTIVTGKTLTINGGLEAGLYQIFSCAGTGKVDLSTNRSIKEVYTEWWGAKADGTTDSTAAFQSCFNALGTNYNDYPIPIRLLSGIYRIHEVTRIAKGLLVGNEVSTTTLQYNGNGGAGSYVIRSNFEDYDNIAVPFSGFKNLTFKGWDGSPSGKIAESLYVQGTLNAEDWGMKFENVSFQTCYGDALKMCAVINFHMNRVRFDGIGGFAISIVGSGIYGTGGFNVPFSLTQWTLDSSTTNIHADFATAAAALGYFDGARWGKGLMSITDMPGVEIHITDGRIELNHRLLPAVGTSKCMILNNNTTANYNPASVYLENFFGYFNDRDAGVVIKDLTGSCNGVFQNIYVYNAAKLYEASVVGISGDTGTYRGDRPGDRTFGASNVKANDYRLGEQGIFVNGRTIEFRNNPPANNVFTPYMNGDLIFNRCMYPWNTLEGWRVVAPYQGYAIPSAPTITNAGVVTTPSKDVTIPAGASWKFLGTGANIKLAGAGAGGSDLLTYVTALDPDGITITINDAPGTSVNPCMITMQAPTFIAMGAHGGATAWRPSLTTADVGYHYWDTDIGKTIFWNGSAWKLADGTAP